MLQLLQQLLFRGLLGTPGVQLLHRDMDVVQVPALYCGGWTALCARSGGHCPGLENLGVIHQVWRGRQLGEQLLRMHWSKQLVQECLGDVLCGDLLGATISMATRAACIQSASSDLSSRPCMPHTLQSTPACRPHSSQLQPGDAAHLIQQGPGIKAGVA